MLYTSRILDRLGYEEKDMRFIKNFIREQEKNLLYVRRWAWRRNVPTEIKSFVVTLKGDKLMRIKRLEKEINKEAKIFFIQVMDDGFTVIMR